MPWLFSLRTLVIGLLLALLSLDASAAGLEARLDRNEVALGEVVQLMLRTDGQGGSNPDLSPLTKDFDILNRGQSSRFEMINGNARSWREWQIALAPKRAGTLTIPSISAGTLASKPTELKVLPAGQAVKPGKTQTVMLEVEADPNQPYVQGKVVYRVRLLSKVPLRQAILTDPQFGDALVERLGDERQFETQRGGQRYRVVERRYAVFPQRSGSLQIDGPVLTAQIPDPSQRGNNQRNRAFGGRDPFARFDKLFGSDPFADIGGMFQQTRPIQLRGESKTLDVQPQPAGTPTPWLPAESVTLNQTWSPNPPEFRVGEPVTRTIAITAQGVTAAQLPDLTTSAAEGLKIYPDKAQSETRADGDTLVTQKVIKAALVPSKAGALMLPAISLSWWDVNNDEQRVAELPARQIEVLPGAAGAAAPDPSTQPSAARQAAEIKAPVVARTEPMQGADGNQDISGDVAMTTEGASWEAGYWPWVALLFAAAWLVSMAMWWRSRTESAAASTVASVDEPVKEAPSDAGKRLREIERACRDNDPRATRRALLDWAAAKWPQHPPQRLEDLAQRLPEDAAAVFNDMDRGQYAADSQAWDGQAAWQALAPMLKQAAEHSRHQAADTSLPPLYAR